MNQIIKILDGCINKSIITYAVLLHLVWSFLFLTGHSAILNITAIHSFTKYIPTEDPYIHGLIFLIVGVFAGVGTMWKGESNKMIGLLLLIPQQILLLISAQGAVDAMVLSAFADGVIRPREFLIADQMPVVLATVLHTVALLRYHVFHKREKILKIINE
jgi:hypothetical protein